MQEDATLLEQVFGEKDWTEELRKFNVRSVEQLASLMATYTGRLAISHLKHPPPSLSDLKFEVDGVLAEKHEISLSNPKSISQRTGFTLQPKEEHGLGYRAPEEFKEIEEIEFGEQMPTAFAASTSPLAPPPPPLQTPGSCDLRSIMTAVRNQFYRGTCVAFTTTALLESKIIREQGESLDLSEQYVFYLARLNDPDRKEPGTRFRYALDGMLIKGVCAKSFWPYNPYDDWGQRFLFDDHAYTLARLEADAAPRRINSYQHLQARSVNDIKQALLNNQPVGIGVPVFKHAWFNGSTEIDGDVLMPFVRKELDGTETVLDEGRGGHAIAIVGYKDTPDPSDTRNYRPGGGYFAFKNSWGTGWAAKNTEVEPGYGQLPYDYVRKYNMSACVIT